MNKSLFKDHMTIIDTIVNKNLHLDFQEINYRKDNIYKEYEYMKSNNTVTGKFYELSHELRCINFLKNYGELYISKDSKHEAGCDFKLNSDIQIEAVCCSHGNEDINGLSKLPKIGVINYTQKEAILLSRLTSSINEKISFYDAHVVNKSIDSTKPYVIFIGLGNLTYYMKNYNYGFELNKILCGVSHPYFTYCRETNSFSGLNYSYTSQITIEKYDKNNIPRTVEIPTNYFCTPDKSCISAIIYSNANLESIYDETNTFIFLNPYAKNKMKIRNFKNLYYWKIDKEGNYVLRKNGKKYNHRENEKWF